MLGDPKKESTFGKPKDSWTFGKKPSKGSFGKPKEPKEKPESKFPEHVRIKDKPEPTFGKPKVETVTLKSGRTKPKSRSQFGRKKTQVKKRELVLPDYMTYLHKEYENMGMDVHHWRTRSDIGRNDFFICMVEHKYHLYTIHGTMSPRGYRDQEGEDNLLENSFLLFAGWLASSYCEDFERGYFKQMLQDLRDNNFVGALEIVRHYAEEYNHMTRSPHHKR